MTSRIRWISISVVLVVAVIVALIWNWSHIKPQYQTSKPSTVERIMKQPIVALKTANLPRTPPAPRPQKCKAQPRLLEAHGVWVVNWSTKNGPMPAADLVDFAWLTWTGENQIKEQFNPRLKTALARQADEYPCQWRLVTLSDGHEEATRVAMAKLLMSGAARNEHVTRIAEYMSHQPQAHGLTLDYEFALPTTSQEISRLYSRYLTAEQRQAPFNQQVDYITQGYTDLVAKLTQAMHMQDRILRVAALVREQDQVSTTYVPPFIMDYIGLRQHANQVVLMAYNHHWQTSDPGAISPTTWVASIWEHVATDDESKLALAIPSYGYDWKVDAAGKRTGGSAKIITGSAQPNWTKLETIDGEHRFSYTDEAGLKHEVWLPAPDEKQQLAESVTSGAPTMIWRVEY